MDLPTVDLGPFLAAEAEAEKDALDQEAQRLCQMVAEQLRTVGVVIVRDPRAPETENNTFLDMMEDYFAQPYETKIRDARPDIGYQLGVTPDHVEVPRCVADPACHERMDKYPAADKPQRPTGADPKWRYFWRVGDRPKETKFPDLNEAQVVPAAFPQWTEVMDRWGQLMQQAVSTVTEMASIGLGLPRHAITSLLAQGPHLLAPTGSDLAQYGEVGQIFAGFHYDLNFLTIHGKSRFPGLYVWRRDGHRVPVRVPDGCLLVQAGRELEWLTGGVVEAGFHEVVVDPSTLEAVERQKARGRPLWRISSTVFCHINSDRVLCPLGPFDTPAARARYPPTVAGDYVRAELETIQLMKPAA